MLTVQTPPTALPVDVAEARAHLRLGNSTAEDARLRRMIAACTRWAQTELQQTLVASRLQLTRDGFGACGRPIELELGPVRHVAGISYQADNGQWLDLAEADYVADLSACPARLAPAYGTTWPSTLPELGSVRIAFDAGHVVPVAADVTADTIRLRGPWPALAVGQPLRFSNSGGALPAPLEPGVDYYVQAVPSAGVCKLAAAPGGAAIDLSTAGTGTSFIGEVPDDIVSWILLRVGDLFNNREGEALIERGQMVSLPFIDRLLDGHRVMGF
jgi:uncharacterized phiE125 gp8 family phage protein